MGGLRIPIATYRLQMNASFSFEEARRIVPFLDELGISDVYSSPVLKARSGSTHGYDVVDANTLNPELGGEDALALFSSTLRDRNMGFLLDIVPNHMAATAENPWWSSVLENGPASRYIHYFDIDWRPGGAEGKERRILLPVLGRPYGEVLESLELTLGFADGEFFLQYYDNRFPLNPPSYLTLLRALLPLMEEDQPNPGSVDEVRELISAAGGDRERQWNPRFLKQTLEHLVGSDEAVVRAIGRLVESYKGEVGRPETFALLDDLVEAQFYRLAYWRMASESINYRRFFDITDLVGVRVEDPEVFEARHGRILRLVEEGIVTGLRIDHIDGLYDPVGHLRRLQSRLDPSWNGDPAEPPFYVVVEKIVAPDEPLPSNFACSGTTGYEFLNRLNAVFVDPHGLEQLERVYAELIEGDRPAVDQDGDGEIFDEVVYRSKKRVIDELFSGEMHELSEALVGLAAHDRNARDFSPAELSRAFVEVTACMSVYRTYIRSADLGEQDRERIERAIAEARERSAAELDPRIFGFLRAVLLVAPPVYLESKKDDWLDFVMKWQQFTGRVTAKGVEDTAFYVYNRLLSLNEVGGEPGGEWIGDPVESFHSFNAAQAARWPFNLNTTSTHDTKRSEDLRARLNVLSELPETFEREVRRWYQLNSAARTSAGGRTSPDRNEEYHIYQTLLGMWPLTTEEEQAVIERMTRYLEKAAREAKVYSSWLSPDEEHEQALAQFVTTILSEPVAEFRSSFEKLRKTVAWFGFINSLSQVVLKVASPGVPDFYQGMESWDFSLVDPDNRHEVDFDRHRDVLREVASGEDRASLIQDMLESWPDGRVKVFTTHASLALRRKARRVFESRDYLGLPASGEKGRNVIAFARREESEWVVAAVPRLVTEIVREGTLPCGELWGDAVIELPDDAPSRWRNVFTGESIEIRRAIEVSSLFSSFPVALLHARK
jgi:(1->4)-alpha-D-glucan 1-alpha-D-glucosylmutase